MMRRWRSYSDGQITKLATPVSSSMVVLVRQKPGSAKGVMFIRNFRAVRASDFDLRVGSSNLSERAKRNQSLRSRLEGLCFPANRIWEATGKLWHAAWLVVGSAALFAFLIFGAAQNALP